MIHKRRLAAGAAALLLLTGCYADFKMKSDDLTLGYAPAYADPVSAEPDFRAAQTDFAVGLLREVVRSSPYTSAVVASYPVAQALGVLANGAQGQNRSEFEKVLGGIPLESQNACFAGLRFTDLWWPKTKFNSNSAVWFRGDRNLPVQKNFVQTAVDCYGTKLYAGAFDAETVEDMNHWISSRSSAEENLVTELPPEAGIAVLCEMVYQGKWLLGYTDDRTEPGKFVQADGSVRETTHFRSDESVFLQSGYATGFTKPYRSTGGRNLEFCALLPNPGVGLWEYLSSLCASNFPQPVENAVAHTVMPEFEVTNSGKLNGALRAMGLYSAFEPGADFSGAVTGEGMYIGEFWQYASMKVTRDGAKDSIFNGEPQEEYAPAVTEPIQTDENGLPVLTPQAAIEEHDVMLNRPFLFFLRDAETGVPLLAGVVQSVS